MKRCGLKPELITPSHNTNITSIIHNNKDNCYAQTYIVHTYMHAVHSMYSINIEYIIYTHTYMCISAHTTTVYTYIVCIHWDIETHNRINKLKQSVINYSELVNLPALPIAFGLHTVYISKQMYKWNQNSHAWIDITRGMREMHFFVIWVN